MIENVKTQPWSMAKKLRMLRTAKAYIKKHEGELAQSKQARDIFATYSNWFRNVSLFFEGENLLEFMEKFGKNNETTS